MLGLFGREAIHVCTVYNVRTNNCILHVCPWLWVIISVGVLYFRLSEPFVNGISALTRGFSFIFFATVTLLNFRTSAAAFLLTASAAPHSQWLIPPSIAARITLPKHDKEISHGLTTASCAVNLVKWNNVLECAMLNSLSISVPEHATFTHGEWMVFYQGRTFIESSRRNLFCMLCLIRHPIEWVDMKELISILCWISLSGKCQAKQSI